MAKRTKTGPRRVGIQVASPTSERVIGRCAAPPFQPLRLTLHAQFVLPFVLRFQVPHIRQTYGDSELLSIKQH